MWCVCPPSCLSHLFSFCFFFDRLVACFRSFSFSILLPFIFERFLGDPSSFFCEKKLRPWMWFASRPSILGAFGVSYLSRVSRRAWRFCAFLALAFGFASGPGPLDVSMPGAGASSGASSRVGARGANGMLELGVEVAVAVLPRGGVKWRRRGWLRCCAPLRCAPRA